MTEFMVIVPFSKLVLLRYTAQLKEIGKTCHFLCFNAIFAHWGIHSTNNYRYLPSNKKVGKVKIWGLEPMTPRSSGHHLPHCAMKSRCVDWRQSVYIFLQRRDCLLQTRGGSRDINNGFHWQRGLGKALFQRPWPCNEKGTPSSLKHGGRRK